MNEIIECPNCLSTGETLIKGNWMKPCKFCKGLGTLPLDLAHSLINGQALDDDRY